VARFGRAEAEQLMLAMNARPPLTVRVNQLVTSRDRVSRRLREEEGLASEPTRWAPEGLVVEHGRPPGHWKVFADGEAVPQDEASMLVTRLLDPRPGETVADVCAAPGTKTGHIAALMGDRGRVIAFDRDGPRLSLVRESAARLGLASVETHAGTVETLAPRFAEACDRVLVDAPCSNLGVLRRNPDVKWRRTPEDIAAARRHQQDILGAAAGMVRPGGVLVYATCSLEPEENDEVVRGLRDARPEFLVDSPPVAFPIALDADGMLRCRPDRHGTDGFTACRLRRAR
jgi:16S rRNA (cytosine967-C5)-methyltransferase